MVETIHGSYRIERIFFLIGFTLLEIYYIAILIAKLKTTRMGLFKTFNFKNISNLTKLMGFASCTVFIVNQVDCCGFYSIFSVKTSFFLRDIAVAFIHINYIYFALVSFLMCRMTMFEDIALSAEKVLAGIPLLYSLLLLLVDVVCFTWNFWLANYIALSCLNVIFSTVSQCFIIKWYVHCLKSQNMDNYKSYIRWTMFVIINSGANLILIAGNILFMIDMKDKKLCFNKEEYLVFNNGFFTGVYMCILISFAIFGTK